MKIRFNQARPLAGAIALGTALLVLAIGQAFATPVVDGILDADYGAALASSPKDNLIVDPAATPAINDPADITAKSIDLTNIYVTNSGNALYIFVRLPHYNLTDPHGDWSIPIHLGGANDGLAVPNTLKDPWGSNVFLNYPSNPNAYVKSNFKSRAAFSDGVNGYAFVHNINAAGNGWDAGLGDFFGSEGGGTPPVGATYFHSAKIGGGEIAYKADDGTGNVGAIEMRIPFSAFAQNTTLTAPVVGNVLKLQFISFKRTPTDGHDRAAIDAVPFEDSIRFIAGPSNDYSQGIATQQVSYTIVAANTPMDVSAAAYTDSTHIALQFTDNVGTGGTTAANYSLVDTDNGNAVIAVSAAAIDAVNTKQVNLTTATLPDGHNFKVTVTNVQSTGSVVVTPARNSATFQSYVDATFTICDNGSPAIIPTTAQFISVFVFVPISKEIDLVKVTGSPNCYTTIPPFRLPPGQAKYKYRIDHSDYDTLNRRDRFNNVTIAGPNVFNDTIGGGPVGVTFNLTDYNAVLPANPVYLFNYNTDPATRILMNPVAGQPGKFTSGSQPWVQNTYEYRYVVVDPNGGTEILDPDSLNQFNRNVAINGSGSPLTQTVNDIAGTPPAPTAAEILRVAAGLVAGPSPATSATFIAMDKDASGNITILDAVKLLHP
jgi:hypothetical protein